MVSTTVESTALVLFCRQLPNFANPMPLGGIARRGDRLPAQVCSTKADLLVFPSTFLKE